MNGNFNFWAVHESIGDVYLLRTPLGPVGQSSGVSLSHYALFVVFDYDAGQDAVTGLVMHLVLPRESVLQLTFAYSAHMLKYELLKDSKLLGNVHREQLKYFTPSIWSAYAINLGAQVFQEQVKEANNGRYEWTSAHNCQTWARKMAQTMGLGWPDDVPVTTDSCVVAQICITAAVWANNTACASSGRSQLSSCASCSCLCRE
eukprot:m51a1_g5062 hypothetical protein (203) ;mRNA; f:115835-116599